MTLLETILTRRSIRKYLKKDIPDEMIDNLLKAAMYAPTARNTQSWEFVVVTNRGMLDQLSEMHPYAKMLKQAPLAIVVCANMEAEPMEGYQSQNCSAATQNIMLLAHSLGLGSVWLGVYPRKERMDPIHEFLILPPHILPYTMISIGFPDEEKGVPERFDKAIIHYNGIW